MQTLKDRIADHSKGVKIPRAVIDNEKLWKEIRPLIWKGESFTNGIRSYGEFFPSNPDGRMEIYFEKPFDANTFVKFVKELLGIDLELLY